jgi:glycine betaine/choline ABC-type transport system substrate-binding protein
MLGVSNTQRAIEASVAVRAMRGQLYRRIFRTVAVPVWVSILLFAGCSRDLDVIVVGSKNFTEQIILGELLATHIEKQLHLAVDRRFNLAGTFICHQAVASGEIDVYVEYTGTAFNTMLGHPPPQDPSAAFPTLQREYGERFGLEWTEPLGFNDTFAIMIRGGDARREKLRTISQSARLAPGWRAGFGYEFLERADGYRGLARTYGLKFAEPPREMDLGLLYRALHEGKVDFIAGNSTEGLVEALDLAILEDDKQYFPRYDAAPVVNQDALMRHPGLGEALAQLSGIISDQEMRNMNYAVDGQGKEVRDVVRDFLASKGL